MNIQAYHCGPIIGGPYELFLDGHLMYLARYIKSIFLKEKFNSFFDNFNIEMYYISEYLGSSESRTNKFNDYYKCLPITRMYRQHRRIVARVKAPELSERFDKLNDYGYYGFQKINLSLIPKRFKDLNDVDLAKLVIDRYVEAGRLISLKLKSGDNFDIAHYEKILLDIKLSISNEFLQKMNIEQEVEIKHEYIDKALIERETRRKSIKQDVALLKGIELETYGLTMIDKPSFLKLGRILEGRLLSFNEPFEVLEPYAYRYSKIFTKVLRQKKLLCQNRKFLSIIVAESTEYALVALGRHDGGDQCGIAIFDYKKYKTLTEKEKARVVFDIFCQGLRDYADLDKLDSTIIEETIKEVGAIEIDTGLNLLDKSSTSF